MFANYGAQNRTESLSRASGSKSIVGDEPRSDGLSSIIDRIGNLASELHVETAFLKKIADRLSGQEPSEPESQVQNPPQPQSTVFVARQIELALIEIIGQQRSQISRIASALF